MRRLDISPVALWLLTSVALLGASLVPSLGAATQAGAPGDGDNSNSVTGYSFPFRGGAAGDWMQVTKLLAPDAAPGDLFGGCVDVDGDTMAVGAPFGDGPGGATGSAYVLEREPATGRWQPVRELIGSAAAEGDLFGLCVAIEGDTIFVGAPVSESPTVTPSQVYVFERDAGSGAWSETQILQPADGAANDFGASLAADGDTLAVGAFTDADLGAAAGAAYLFERDPGTGAWLEVAKLFAADGGPDDRFGGFIDLDGTTLVAGLAAASDRRIAYVFERDPATGAWLEVDTLTPASGHVSDDFGFGVALAGGTAVIGARNDDDAGVSAGAVYIFERDPATGSWSESSKLVPFDGRPLTAFGQGVALEGDLLVVTDHEDTTTAPRDGSLYVYERGAGGWMLAGKLGASDPGAFDNLGRHVALDGTTLVVGADDDAEDDRGTAYVFRRVGLGGSITGGGGRQALCRNEDTAQSVLIALSGATSWDCAAAGLVAAPGERVTQRAVHVADGNTVSGAAAGLDVRQVQCRNRTTGQTVVIHPEGAGTWSCERAGLTVTPGDLVTQTISGRAD